jgi:signal transduction histidine kinase
VSALYVESFIEPSVVSLASGDWLSDAEVARLDELLTETALGERVVAMRIWTPDGTIVYSPESELIGQRFPVDGGLAEALEGHVEAEMSDLSAAENALEAARFDRLLEMYIPVREPGSERIIAVAETYQLPDDIDREVAEAQAWAWAIVAVAVFVSVVLLWGIVKQGSDTIGRQERALTRQVGELSALLRQNEALRDRVAVAAERTTTLNERAMRRISSDLHDGPGQLLSLALMRLDALRLRAVEGATTPAADLGEVEGDLKDAMKDMRSIAAGLRLPELADLSLGEVVSRAVDDHRRRSGDPVELVAGPLPSEAPLPVKIACFRALGELLSNASRHGGGDGITVRVEVVDGQLRVRVSDTGPGFDPATLEASTGLGLPGIREQAELLGGGFEVRSGPGAGTAMTVRWPLARPGQAAT